MSEYINYEELDKTSSITENDTMLIQQDGTPKQLEIETALNNKITTEISKIVANAPEDFDTLKEMSDWIAEHEDDATAMNTAINNKANKDLSNVTGTLDIANGGTGATTTKGAQNNLLSAMEEVTSSPVDDSLFAMKYTTPSDTNGALYSRKASLIWDYIKGKIASVLGLTASTYSGKATTAGTADTAKACTGNSATATRAEQDNSGNNIVDTYATKKELKEKTLSNSFRKTIVFYAPITNTTTSIIQTYALKEIASALIGSPNYTGEIISCNFITSSETFSLKKFSVIQSPLIGSNHNGLFYGEIGVAGSSVILTFSNGTIDVDVTFILGNSTTEIKTQSLTIDDSKFLGYKIDDVEGLTWQYNASKKGQIVLHFLSL